METDQAVTNVMPEIYYQRIRLNVKSAAKIAGDKIIECIRRMTVSTTMI